MQGNKFLDSLLAVSALVLVLVWVPVVKAENLTLILQAGDYQIVNVDKGQEIKMTGFGYLGEPGKPMLPAKRFLIALPPGATIQSVSVEGINGIHLPGRYKIIPQPPIMPAIQNQKLVQKSRTEWRRNNQAVYSSDEAYPKERGRLTALGSLRKYSYVSISFCPFEYHPQSGKLIYYPQARVSIDYTLSSLGREELKRLEQLNWDRVADERASQLFINFQEAKQWYQPKEQPPKGGTYDYIIITTPEHVNAITSSNFIPWKRDSLGYRVKVVLTNDPEIANQEGNNLAVKIRNFLKSYYAFWHIKYVLLVGNHVSVPMPYFFPDFSNHSYDPGNPNMDSGEVPSDYFYADLTGDWDSDGDGFWGEYGQDNVDFAPEVYVGRIPTVFDAQITTTLNKIVTFEQDTSSWKNRALDMGAIFYYTSGYRPWIDDACLMDLIETDFLSGWTISHYSERGGLVPSPYEWDALSPTVCSEWRNGQYGVVNWAAHGWTDAVYRKVWEWDDGDEVPESGEMGWYPFITVNSSLNGDYPSIVYALSCFVGYPETNEYGNLGIDLLINNSTGAAVSIICASRVSWLGGGFCDIPEGGGDEAMCYEFYDYWVDQSKTLGNAFYDSKFSSHINYGWQDWYEYWNMFAHNLYGDPSLAREGVIPSSSKPPRVVETSPAINALGVSQDAYISAVFNTSMDSSTFDTSTVILYGAIQGRLSGTVSYNGDMKTVTFHPSTNFHTGELISTILTTGIKSLAQIPLDGYEWRFTVQAETSSTGSFGNFSTYSTGPGPYSTIAADLDGDGDIDLATANVDSKDISVLLNYGWGQFSPPADYPLSVTPSSMCSGDFNADGFPDLAVTSYDLNGILIILLNEGMGNFPNRDIYLVGAKPSDVCVRDFNADGYLDLATANINSQDVSIFLNNGDGTFQPPTRYDVKESAFRIVPTDVDNDGVMDLIVASKDDNSISILLNNGEGEFSFPITTYSISYSPISICSADFNGDGYSDIAVGNQNCDSISVLFNDGDGNILSRASYYVSSAPYSVCSGDFDDDGDIDLATCLISIGKVGVLLNNGGGDFDSVATFSGADGPYSIGTADLNENGALDLFVANYDQDNISVLFNTKTVGVNSDTKHTCLPKSYKLSQNYPNPFNATTVIRYSLPGDRSSCTTLKGLANGSSRARNTLHVRLEVYNILGQKVATLVDEKQTPGYKAVTWDAKDMASGIYFYRLKAGEFTAIKKMILLK